MAKISEHDRRRLLLSVERPGRYTGGEFGQIRKEGALKVALSYPDLYEIGMSNYAIKILYDMLNRIEGVQCERVFAPALDCEAVLRGRNLLLFSLESGLPLSEFDIIAFSVGYELNATCALQILAAGGVPIRAVDRTDGDPVVIAGGPGVVNPVPFKRFFDFMYIGEAEGWIDAAFRELVDLKRKKAGRGAILSCFSGFSCMTGGQIKTVRRAVWSGFARDRIDLEFPVSNIKAAQDHGMVEIMRGCPNGCRFCNAGFLYRPYRAKPVSRILHEIYRLIFKYGYREISLASLSSGDYPAIRRLMAELNDSFAPFGVSFSLPSLKIDTLALDLFSAVKTVRKSGLTFAVESPCGRTQAAINKIVSWEKIRALLAEAREQGWRQAKFYFMLGLPEFLDRDESDLIVDYLLEISRACRMSFSINIGTFVPKPHTPFQWCGQLDEETALERIKSIRHRLSKAFFKLSYHMPFQSFLEGLIARGDARAGEIVERAFLDGARFEAWEEHVNIPLWKNILAKTDWDVASFVCRAKSFEESFPWDFINTGVSKSFLRQEAEKVQRGELTDPCSADCKQPCGVCGGSVFVENQVPDPESDPDSEIEEKMILQARTVIGRGEARRVLFAFSKTGPAIFLSHLNLMTIFERAFQRAGYFCRMTGGFNPKPLLEFASPLPLGFSSRFEVALVHLYNFDTDTAFIRSLNDALPDGLKIHKAKELEYWKTGERKYSLMGSYWGDDYILFVENSKTALERMKSNFIHFSSRFSSDRKINSRLVLRHQTTGLGHKSFKKNLEDFYLTGDYLSFCQPVRIMTLMKTADGKIGNYFHFFK